MKDTAEIAAARIEAERARQKFLDSLRAFEGPILDLKSQLTPSHLIGDAWDAAKEKGADLAEDAVDAVRSRPLAVTGAITAVALFLAREPLMDLAGKLTTTVSKKRAAKKTKKPKKSETEAVE